MTRAMAVLGYFLKIATIAVVELDQEILNGDSRLTVNVLGLVDVDLTNSKLAVGGLGCTVTTGQVVDDECGDLVARNVFDTILDDLDLCAGVTASLSVGKL
jgi:hypothetical protein